MLSSASFPGHEQELTLPNEVVVFTFYSGRGVQVQPFETLKQGLRELNQLTPDVDAARAIADRLIALSVPQGDAMTWEYYFPFGGPSRPWSSTMSQALATEFFQRVGAALPEAERAPYAAAAEGAARAFLRSPSRGGVAVAEGPGRFYLMYPFAPAQRILNGHLQSLLNLNRYATASGSPVAARVVRQGIAAVLPLLPRFDTGAWSNYQLGQEADLNYHEFQSEQLVKLGEELQDEIFATYGERFTTYLQTPPKLTLGASDWPSIIPAPDGFRDRITIRYALDKRARVTLVVSDANGAEVWRGSESGGRGSDAIAWGARTASGAIAPDGEYTGRLTSTDIVGNRAVTEIEAPLRVTRDQLAPELRLMVLRERGAASIVTATALDAGSAYIVAQVRIDGRIVASARGGRVARLTMRVPRPISDVRRGTLVLRDSTGNEQTTPLGS